MSLSFTLYFSHLIELVGKMYVHYCEIGRKDVKFWQSDNRWQCKHNVDNAYLTRSLYRSVDCIRLWCFLIYLSSIFRALLCLRSSWCCTVNFFWGYVLFFTFWWAESGRIGPWPGCTSVLWRCWLSHMTCKIVSEMTYNVSSGALNPTIPTLYYSCILT